MNKGYRQTQILDVVRRKPVYTQEELAGELRTRGLAATQVTLSRDIRELGLVKTPEGYRQITAAPAAPDIDVVISEFLREVRQAQNLLVLRTPPGSANVLALALDRQDWPDVVGTVAGDDTVLVIAPDEPTAKSLRDRFFAYLAT
jgi:transcriptional regulator of arginine metabolism